MQAAHLRVMCLVGLGLLSGCDYSGDWLFSQPIEGLPAVYHITRPNGSPLVPADVSTPEEVREATIYGEVAASQRAELGGITAEFVGTGDEVCIWVDPEVVNWTQSIGVGGESKFSYPDNTWDDGDLDLRVGLSVYYTGSPDRLGDFEVTYEDDLGNPVPIQLQDCPNEQSAETEGLDATAGQGSADRCTIQRTEPGVSYTIVLRSWSTPIDDDRLGFGLLLANGSCNDLQAAAGWGNSPTLLAAECVVRGEAIVPLPLENDEADYQPVFGFSALQEMGMTYGSMLDLEDAYCTFPNDGSEEPLEQPDALPTFCQQEARRVARDGAACLWDGYELDETNPREKVKCFCGDPNDTPQNGPG